MVWNLGNTNYQSSRTGDRFINVYVFFLEVVLGVSEEWVEIEED